MIKKLVLIFVLLALVPGLIAFSKVTDSSEPNQAVPAKDQYWLILHRKSNVENLYKVVPGDESKSTLVRKFKVNDGVEGRTPTPLPSLLGKKYWVIDDKEMPVDNSALGPRFLTLNIPVTEEWPYGPVPYKECDGQQCDWQLPGYFGLHGVGGDETKLTDAGSSGCVRHKDEDIVYLYKTLDPKIEEIRYYVEEN